MFLRVYANLSERRRDSPCCFNQAEFGTWRNFGVDSTLTCVKSEKRKSEIYHIIHYKLALHEVEISSEERSHGVAVRNNHVTRRLRGRTHFPFILIYPFISFFSFPFSAFRSVSFALLFRALKQ